MNRHRRTVITLFMIISFAALPSQSATLHKTIRANGGTRQVTIRKPGQVKDLLAAALAIHTNTELRMNCLNSTDNGLLQYGAVLDDKCYTWVKDFLFVKSAAVDFTTVTGLSATGCVPETRCNSASTLFRCKEADVVCYGVDPKGLCDPSIQPVVLQSCHALVYTGNGEAGWMCKQGDMFPGAKNNKASCRYIEAKRQDVESWPDYFIFGTLDHYRAIFAAAYAVEAKVRVQIPHKPTC